MIPISGIYDIIAAGAQGGGNWDNGGYGAEMSGLGYFEAGTDLGIVVGGGGSSGDGAGGGGGSFVFEGTVPEPATWAMLILGVAMIGFATRRRREGVAVAV